jgi:sec-independent protein translocase protein TatB
MFDIAWSEMALVGAVALVVIGPKDLPKVMREVGKLLTQGRTMARSFRSGFDEMMRESELEDIRASTASQFQDIDQSIRSEPTALPTVAEASPTDPALKA